MPTIVLSRACLDALEADNIRATGCGMSQDSIPRQDGRFDVPIGDQVFARLEALRFPGESHEACIWRILSSGVRPN